MKKITILLLLMLLMLTPSVSAWSINPAKWTFYNKDDYEIKPIVFNMEIKNDDPSPIVIHLSVIDPEYLYSGTEPLPDKLWISISQAEVTIQGNSSVQIPITITIPEQYTNGTLEVSNYNKSYEAWIFADMIQGGGNIQVDYRCRWVFDTPLRYVPPSERAGYVDNGFYLMLFGAVILVVIVLFVVFRVIKRKPKPTTNPKRKSKKIETEESDDLFK